MTDIREEDLLASIAGALQFIPANHPADYIANLAEAWRSERSTAARDAMGRILVNSRMAALGRRPMCQDTGTAQVFMRVGLGAGFLFNRSLQEVADDAVRRAWQTERNPLRAMSTSRWMALAWRSSPRCHCPCGPRTLPWPARPGGA